MNLLVLPLLIPLVSAAALLLAWRSPRIQRVLGVLGTSALLAVSLLLLFLVRQEGILAAFMGDWPAPFGITLVADLFSVIMLVMIALLGLITSVYSLSGIDPAQVSSGYYPMLQVLLLGGSGILLTGDLFDLYVWLEVMIIASFVLMVLGGSLSQLKGSVKYVVLTLVASSILLSALGMLYGVAGTLNMADLGRTVGQEASGGIVTVIGVLFLVGLGIKSAAFPLFFWLPDSYHTPPAAVTAIFSAILTKVGIYALVRIFTLVFVGDAGYIHLLILVMAGFTMVTGVLGAVAQDHMRRLLSFHIVSQIGYPLMGLGIFTPLGLGAAVFFLVHIILVKATLFFVNGIVERTTGTNELKKLGGIYRSRPLLAAMFLIPALSLAGIPPFTGFFAKLALVRAGIETSQYAIVITSLAVSILTLFSMMKVWREAFWKQKPPERVIRGLHPRNKAGLLISTTLAAVALTVVLSAASGFIFDISLSAGIQLLDPSQYINAVFGGSP